MMNCDITLPSKTKSRYNTGGNTVIKSRVRVSFRDVSNDVFQYLGCIHAC